VFPNDEAVQAGLEDINNNPVIVLEAGGELFKRGDLLHRGILVKVDDRLVDKVASIVRNGIGGIKHDEDLSGGLSYFFCLGPNPLNRAHHTKNENAKGNRPGKITFSSLIQIHPQLL